MVNVPHIKDFSVDNIVLVGGLSKISILQQFSSFYSTLPTLHKYDAVIIITNGKEIPGETPLGTVVTYNIPHFVIQIDSGVVEYSDNFSDFIRNSGGVFCRDFTQVIEKVMINNHTINVANGYVFYKTNSTQSEYPSLPQLDNILSRQFIFHLSQNQTIKDKMHTVAKKHGVVSPYSSLIITQNIQELNQNEMRDDRFSRNAIKFLFSFSQLNSFLNPTYSLKMERESGEMLNVDETQGISLEREIGDILSVDVTQGRSLSYSSGDMLNDDDYQGKSLSYSSMIPEDVIPVQSNMMDYVLPSTGYKNIIFPFWVTILIIWFTHTRL